MYANDAYIYDFGKQKKEENTTKCCWCEVSEKEKTTELNRKKIIFYVFAVRCAVSASSSSFISLLMVFNSSKTKIYGAEKKGDPIFLKASIGERGTKYANTLISSAFFPLLALGRSLSMHIIIAVNHFFSSPCQQAFLYLFLLHPMRVCVFFRWKDKRRWMEKKPKKDKQRMG